MQEEGLPGIGEGLIMSRRDIDRVHAIRNVLEGRLKQRQAAEILGLSVRQVKRLCKRMRMEGTRGIRHGLRGRPSNHRLAPELLEQALSGLHDPLWESFGPTFAQEKLERCYGLVLSDWTVRHWMTRTGLWHSHRHYPQHRSWRERRACFGMLVQLDGSDHDWFEGRGPRCVLIAYVDDATSRVPYAEFVGVEDTLTLLRTTRVYLQRWGRPVAFYVDKDSIYKVNRQATVEEDLRDEQPLTQFTRAMAELGIRVIPANSPQAKGRVERGFGTHQDRLVKELRLRGISEVPSANRYLWDEYLPEHNGRYAVEPAQPTDAHRPLLSCQDLDAILSLQTPREVGNDFTVRYKNRFFQLQPDQPMRVYRKAQVSVQERLDGSIHLVFKGQRLNFHPIAGRPIQKACRLSAKPKATPAPAPARRPRVSPLFRAFSLSKTPLNPPASYAMQS